MNKKYVVVGSVHKSQIKEISNIVKVRTVEDRIQKIVGGGF